MEKSQPPPAPEKAEASGLEGSLGSGGGGASPRTKVPPVWVILASPARAGGRDTAELGGDVGQSRD